MRKECKWIKMELVRHLPRTSIYDVVKLHDGYVLGKVRWYPQWRKYSFIPAPETVFEPDCLRDIASFCEELMEERKIEKNKTVVDHNGGVML